jgi:hypothetical protein
MASAVHIPISELPPEMKSILDRALLGETIVFDGDGKSLRLTPVGKTIAEILANEKLWAAADALDEDWSKDLEEVVALRKIEVTPDPWV